MQDKLPILETTSQDETYTMYPTHEAKTIEPKNRFPSLESLRSGSPRADSM